MADSQPSETMRKYGRKDVDYETWYTPWMKQLARTCTRNDLERSLYGTAAAAKKGAAAHLRAIEATHSMQSQSMRRAHAGNVVAAAGDKAIALRGALEIHDLFPEHAAAGVTGGPQIAPADVERLTVAPEHDPAQGMAHNGSASGVSVHPSRDFTNGQ